MSICKDSRRNTVNIKYLPKDIGNSAANCCKFPDSISKQMSNNPGMCCGQVKSLPLLGASPSPQALSTCQESEAEDAAPTGGQESASPLMSSHDFELEGLSKEERIMKQMERQFYQKQKCFNQEHHQLEEKLETQHDTLKCKVCLDSQVEVFFYPCCHLVSCSECSQQLLICPICRSNIKTRFRVYMV